MSDQNQPNKDYLDNKLKAPKKVWKRDDIPTRNIILWGLDSKSNPSVLILYGKQQFKPNIAPKYNFLEDDVKYTKYVIFKGQEGHMPSFQTVKIITNDEYYNRHHNKNDDLTKMYYKTAFNGGDGDWKRDESYRIKDFKILNSEKQLVFPYFRPISHEQYIEQIEAQNIEFDDFRLVKNPNEILKLNGELYKYYDILYDIMGNPNLYTRKKRLKELLYINPPQAIYELLLKVGSTELISGLFLELSKMKNPVLIEQADAIIDSELNWAGDKYIEGLKRCANIYLNSLDENLKKKRIEWIQKSLPEMDLNLIRIANQDIPSDKILYGYDYRKYSLQGLMLDRNMYNMYDEDYITPILYKEGSYTDGKTLNIIKFKNTIQEAEIYGLADVIGKIAYYLDAPRLNYYFRGSIERKKSLSYFKRYIKRIVNFYAKSDPDKFMKAMKSLLTSYTKYDCLCKFEENYQFNEFIRYYLYYDFKEKAPYDWALRDDWLENDQLMKLEGRYEFMKEIWDNHLADVLDIAIGSDINPVLKACYYILKSSYETNSKLIDSIPYKQLIDLVQSSYKPLSDMFINILLNKVNQLNTFEPELMLTLISSSNTNMHLLAIEFFRRTKGRFTPANLVEFVFIENFNEWIELFKENLLSFDELEYIEFVKAFIDTNDRFIKLNITFSEDIKDTLSLSMLKLETTSQLEKINLTNYILTKLFENHNMSEYISIFMEDIIFSFSYDELESILKTIAIDSKKAVLLKNKQIISILESIQTKSVPSDAQIISILESGTSKIIKTLIGIIGANSEILKSRLSTLLIMFESNITSLNKQAENIFNQMDKENQMKLHSIILDSPVNRVYLYALKLLDTMYGDLVPEKFIIQMLEHTAFEIKAYISDKINKILDNFEDGNKEIFMYYVKTLLLLPNKVSKSKDNIYKAIPNFVTKYKDKSAELENILLDIGGSNIIKDSESALVTLAQMKRGVYVES